jgi:hypothetical protein
VATTWLSLEKVPYGDGDAGVIGWASTVKAGNVTNRVKWSNRWVFRILGAMLDDDQNGCVAEDDNTSVPIR